MCDSAEDFYSTLCPHDKLAPKAKCGHTQRQSSDAGGRGEEGGGGCGGSGKKKSVACLCHHGYLVTAPALPAKAGPALTRSIPWSVRLNHDEGRRKHERDYGPWDGAPVTVSWTDWGTEVGGGGGLGRLGEIKSHVLWEGGREQNLSTAVCQLLEPQC